MAADVADPSLAMGTDMDDDGDMDFLFANGNDIGWYENANGDYRTLHMIAVDSYLPNEFHRHDLNGDGKLDLQVSSYSKVALFENHGNGEAFVELEILDLRDVRFVDLDNDGDIDAHGIRSNRGASRTDSLVVLFNHEGVLREAFSRDYPSTISRADGDLNRDGDADILVYVNTQRTRLPNGDWEFTDPKFVRLQHPGNGQFDEQSINASNDLGHFSFDETRLVDLNGDGQLDLIGEKGNNVWLENASNRTFLQRRRDRQGFSSTLDIVDFDADGDIDVIAERGPSLFWHRNDGNGNFEYVEIANETGLISSASASDVDEDGDLDIVFTVQNASQIGWYENRGNDESFDQHVINNPGPSQGTLTAISDKDQDGDLDLLVSVSRIGQLMWYENQGDATRFQLQDTESSRASHSWMVDVDGDGNPDYVAPDEYTHHAIADINGDGNDDILDKGRCWCGLGTEPTAFGEGGPPIDIGLTNSSSGLDFGDVDGDGDLDVVTTQFENILVHLNEDGKGTFRYRDDGVPNCSERDYVPRQARRLRQ